MSCTERLIDLSGRTVAQSTLLLASCAKQFLVHARIDRMQTGNTICPLQDGRGTVQTTPATTPPRQSASVTKPYSTRKSTQISASSFFANPLSYTGYRQSPHILDEIDLHLALPQFHVP